MTPSKIRRTPSPRRVVKSPSSGKKQVSVRILKTSPLKRGLFEQSLQGVDDKKDFAFILQNDSNLDLQVQVFLGALQMILYGQTTLKYHGIGNTISIYTEFATVVFIAKKTVEQCEIVITCNNQTKTYAMYESQWYNSTTFSLYGHIQTVFEEVFNFII